MDHAVLRITKELSDIQKTSDLSLAVACRDADVRSVKALIMGPHETPYEFGFFEFLLRFPKDYPSKSPNVKAVTTNGGRSRFNPNIYSCGKVCLSILGTWRGEPGEEWSSAQGMESILLSIQSLLSVNPYENEPGFEDANSPSDKENQESYVRKIRHETLRISVIQRLERYLEITPANAADQASIMLERRLSTYDDIDDGEIPFEPFKDLCKRRFLWYFESYVAAIQKGKSETVDGTPFKRMPFEMPNGNTMDGKFAYADLERRLNTVKAAIDAETGRWAEEGHKALQNESTVAVNLQHQFQQVVESFKRSDIPHNVDLENRNPFVWIITYFGRPMTNLDGGLLRIKINFSPRFPHEQPRAKLLTKIFHHLVSADGTICYTPNPMKQEDIRTHIEAIFEVLEEDDPAYDPRKIVNPEASKMYWSGGLERKQYNRRLRRSVQQSMEDFDE